ncbi:uncharacterized protein LOC108916417 [Anoplophora glabripennis]|uniref:uncharacterized protein LOC108916417 n=1 Tax=Anoplophora glabripennis TaxID=217634 RepID=UPI000873A66F|nr:uncharacterized protein LOC108916417 [Anoplophora glabripennis]
MRIFSCYFSPNRSLEEFENFLSNLEHTFREIEVIIEGDFNGKSPLWGGEREDRRGIRLAEWLFQMNLRILNEGKAPTFERGDSRSHIDITACTERLVAKIGKWRVMEEETLSLHKYIYFEASNGPQNRRSEWKYAEFDKSKAKEGIRRHPVFSQGPFDEKTCIKALGEACKPAVVRTRGRTRSCEGL